ncbi:hypothetical protein AGABI1DRAFT_108939 [Agaricus bisporus var. burnettii JB137-S8]|uniref:Glycoside hydrolase family 2 catalytic domain-containing protein n=1 Tax=Agaricus bisporus var. burnettii (strain JB137-S8 / ATCC MYA-4627 / FGSC 10392) TaxID=597362 RepID=K5WLL5_AGABU|nr:uncharacterized protein AGABI1DRAFT_108939 [Agaricus bisporus var. burnettii JB137-S8]EKM76186.1 hypothetical protein AGABI1DRAFT_108939 [Agaricus bisporus var. burnettii JB137-S8]
MLQLKRFQVVVLLGGLLGKAIAQTWCGKHYMASQSSSEPGGEFSEPTVSSEPLIALRCAQAIRPYLPADANSDSDPTAVSILIDTSITFRKVNGAQAINIPSNDPSSTLQVTVSIDGKTLTSGDVPLNSTKHALPFSLSSLSAQTAAHEMTCTATLSDQKFTASGLLTYLPDPPSDIGSVTKMDLRTGALLARPANGNGGDFAPVLPVGFYTQFNGYLAKDLSISSTLAEQGFTIVHPIPEFSDISTLDAVLDKMQEAGLYLMYDMRLTYMDSDSVRTQVNHIKSRPNLLLWYTADEPDGTSDPLDATLKSSNLITSLDGGDGEGGAGYHPVSLVLNCENYHFTEYTAGSDIVMQDAYMVGNNVTFSTVWGTPCNTTYGDCGCDNCKGSFKDIADRMDSFKDHLFVNGWERTKAVWTVPQGFGEETYWKRYPTGKEFVIESVVGINHGGLGVVSWDDPTSDDIKSSASKLALAMPKMTPFILSVNASFRQITLDQVDIGLWTVDGQTLVLGANMDNSPSTVDFSQLGLPNVGSSDGVNQVLDSGATADVTGNKFTFDGTGSGAWVVKA